MHRQGSAARKSDTVRARSGKALASGRAKKGSARKAVVRHRFDGTPASGNYPGLRCDWCDRLIRSAGEAVAHWLPNDPRENPVEIIHRTHLATASPHARWMELTKYLALLTHNLRLRPDDLVQWAASPGTVEEPDDDE